MEKTNWLGACSWSQTKPDKLTGQLLTSFSSGHIVWSLLALSEVPPTEWPMGLLGACLPSEKQGETLLPRDPCGPLIPPTCQVESLGAYIPKQLFPNLQQTPKQTPSPHGPKLSAWKAHYCKAAIWLGSIINSFFFLFHI